MADENVTINPTQEPVTQANPEMVQQFADSIWNNTPPQTTQQTVTQEPPAQQTITQEPKKEEYDVLDSNEWLKQTFGWETVDAGRAELDSLRKRPEQAAAAEIQFANDESRRYYDAVTNGKADELYNILHQQKQLTRLESIELKTAQDAAEIIKANLQFKHKDLSQHEIERIFSRQYGMPPQPKQRDEQSDEDYAVALDEWKAQVQEKEQDMIIDAKLARPELSKYKSELVFPDIQRPETTQGPSQEELAAFGEYKKGVHQSFNDQYKNFNGYEVVFKDAEVEIPISYVVDDNEKSSLKESVIKDVLGEHFNVNDFFGNRWFDKEGKPNVALMMADKYFFENRDKILQKIANEAGTKRLEHHLKTQSKINVNGQTSQPATVFNNTNQMMDELANVAFQ